MKYLKEYPDILVMRADKGNATLLLNKQKYSNKANFSLSDRSIYTELRSVKINIKYVLLHSGMVRKYISIICFSSLSVLKMYEMQMFSL